MDIRCLSYNTWGHDARGSSGFASKKLPCPGRKAEPFFESLESKTQPMHGSHAKCPTFINNDDLGTSTKKNVPHRPSVIPSSIHFSSILSAKTCANVARSDHLGPSCLVQIQASSQVITETSLTEKHNTAHLRRKLWMCPGWFLFAKKEA